MNFNKNTRNNFLRVNGHRSDMPTVTSPIPTRNFATINHKIPERNLTKDIFGVELHDQEKQTMEHMDFKKEIPLSFLNIQMDNLSGQMLKLSDSFVEEINQDMRVVQLEHVGQTPFGFVYTAFNYFKDFLVDSFRGSTQSDIEDSNIKLAIEESMRCYNEKENRDLHIMQEKNERHVKKSLSNSYYRNLLEEISLKSAEKRHCVLRMIANDDDAQEEVKTPIESSDSPDEFYDGIESLESFCENSQINLINSCNSQNHFDKNAISTSDKSIYQNNIAEAATKIYEINQLSDSIFDYNISFPSNKPIKKLKVKSQPNNSKIMKKLNKTSVKTPTQHSNVCTASKLYCESMSQLANKRKSIDRSPISERPTLDFENLLSNESLIRRCDTDVESVSSVSSESVIFDYDCDSDGAEFDDDKSSDVHDTRIRCRTVSEDSTDSFVVFANDSEQCVDDVHGCGEYDAKYDCMDDIQCGDSDVETECESVCAEDEVDFVTVKPPKKTVQFKSCDQLVKIHPIIKWDYAYRSARKGPWEEFARDDYRFKLRIDRLSKVLSPVLNPDHRRCIYLERFDKLQ